MPDTQQHRVTLSRNLVVSIVNLSIFHRQQTWLLATQDADIITML